MCAAVASSSAAKAAAAFSSSYAHLEMKEECEIYQLMDQLYEDARKITESATATTTTTTTTTTVPVSVPIEELVLLQSYMIKT